MNVLNMCLPFELNFAKEKVQEMKDFNIEGILINEKRLETINIEGFNEDSLITLKKKKKEITVKAKEINWYIGKNLIDFFSSDNYMLCFRYKTCLLKNYIKNDSIYDKFINLLNKMIQSEIIKNAMIKDSQAAIFEYPFSNEDIRAECQNAIKYVPFPTSAVYGFTDKYSFNIYIYSNISTNSLQNIFSEYDNILRTHCHEYKHLTGIYYHLFNKIITIHTPKTNSKLTSQEIIQKKKKDIIEAYNFRQTNYNEIKELDYGDIFEQFWVSNKYSKFFLANSYFCLKESTWEMNIEEFDSNFIKNIKTINIRIVKNEKSIPFITSVLNLFKIKVNKIFLNEMTKKNASKDNKNDENDSDVYENSYINKEIISHYNFTK